MRQTGTSVPKSGYFPEKCDHTIASGIFCISLADLGTYLARTGNNAAAGGSESPRGAGHATPGSGPYQAQNFTDPSLPKHTIFAPMSPPPGNLSVPFIAQGNGGCGTNPTSFRNFLVEVASYGYVIAAERVAGCNIGLGRVLRGATVPFRRFSAWLMWRAPRGLDSITVNAFCRTPWLQLHRYCLFTLWSWVPVSAGTPKGSFATSKA